jgi:hypothetical protein
MFFSKKDGTTNSDAMILAIAEIAEGLVIIFTLGRKRPSWHLKACTHMLDYKYGPVGECE